MSPHPVFDPVVHEPSRLQICAHLVPLPEAGFRELRDALGLSDSALSKHLRVLEESGYVALKKVAEGGHVVTRAVLTEAGREALCGHIAEIQRMARIVAPRVRPPR